MTNRFFSPSEQFANSAGTPYSGGSLAFYASGTNTPLNVYSDSALSVVLLNPVTLDSAGRAGSIFLQNLAYKVVLKDALANQIWTEDPVYASDFSTVAQLAVYAGNPNGHVAGTAGSGSTPSSVVWDTADNILYVCTTTGTAITAVWTVVNPPDNAGRTLLTASRTYYVRTDGSDSNNGLTNTAGGAFLTIQHAVDFVRFNIDLGGYACTIQVADGAYTAGLFIADRIPFVGGTPLLQGNTTTPSNCIIAPSGTPQAAIQVTYNTALAIGGFKLVQTANSFCTYTSGGALLYIQGAMEYGACISAHIVCASHGTTVITANYTVSAGSLAHLYAYHDGFIEYGNGLAVTVAGTPVFTDFALVANGIIAAAGATYSGSATGNKYSAQSNGVIDSGGAVFPGNVAGSTSTGGQYL